MGEISGCRVTLVPATNGTLHTTFYLSSTILSNYTQGRIEVRRENI